MVIWFKTFLYGRLLEFTDLMISAPGESVYVTMDDNRRIGACNRMGAERNLGWEEGAGQEKHSII